MCIKKTKNYLSFTLAVASICALDVSAFEINAGDSTATIYGFAKLNMIYDMDERLGTFVTHGSIRLDGEDYAEGHTQFDASHSRLGVKVLTDTNHGSITTVIEGDFNTAGGTGPFRLRHAYGEWNGIMAGQNWSNFGGFLATMPTLDHLGQVGQGVILRQPQLRYTRGGLSVALEEGGAWRGSVSGSAAPSIDTIAKGSLPDFTARYQHDIGFAKASISGVLRQIEYYDETSDSEESEYGWGVNFETQIPLSNIVLLRGSVTYGQGMGGYQYLNPAGAGYVDSTGEIQAIDSLGGTLGLSVKAGPGNINLGYGRSTADIDNAVDAGALPSSANEAFDSIYLNYIWSPVAGVTYGIEGGKHRREVHSGADGDAVRLQAQLTYAF